MSSSGKKISNRQPTEDFHMKTRRGSSQEVFSQENTSGSDLPNPAIITTQNSTLAMAERSSPRPVTPEQTEMVPQSSTSRPTAMTKTSSARRKIGTVRPGSPEAMYTTSPLGPSPLSSALSSLETTPEGITMETTRPKPSASPTHGKRATRRITTLTGVRYDKLSSEKRMELKRKAGEIDEEDDFVTVRASKRVKKSVPEKSSLNTKSTKTNADSDKGMELKRKAGEVDEADEEDDFVVVRASKRVKKSVPEKSSLTTKSTKTTADSNKHNRKVRFVNLDSPTQEKSGLMLLADAALSGLDGISTNPLSSSHNSNTEQTPNIEPGPQPKPKRKTKSQLELETDVGRHGEWIEATIFGHENAKKPVFYGADGVTQYTEPERISPGKGGKDGVKKRKGGGGWNKGLGKGKGKGKGKGRGRNNRRDDDEEDPFEGKESTTDDQKNVVKLIKARQALLRTFFRDVGRQQTDILDTLSFRDLNKLCRRANAHKKIPEYDDVLEDLQEKKQDAIDLAKTRFELDKKLAVNQFAQQQQLLEQQFNQRCEQVRSEHFSGAQGDIIILEKKRAGVVDDDRTDDGSHNQDPGYFPRYHQFPESNVRGEPVPVRGYTSDKITDERPFGVQLQANNYDDLVRRDVVQSDVMGPIVRSLEVSNQERREAEAREKTQNMMALSNEAIYQLAEVRGYLVPTRLSAAEMNSYALSLLADVSEFHAEHHKEKAFRFLSVAPGEAVPREAVEFEQLPAPRLPSSAPRGTTTTTPAPPANQRTHQFVFQNPGATPATRLPRLAAPGSNAVAPPGRVQQRFPVQFVNQTIESRKAAGNQGKGGQRVLLPKV